MKLKTTLTLALLVACLGTPEAKACHALYYVDTTAQCHPSGDGTVLVSWTTREDLLAVAYEVLRIDAVTMAETTVGVAFKPIPDCACDTGNCDRTYTIHDTTAESCGVYVYYVRELATGLESNLFMTPTVCDCVCGGIAGLSCPSCSRCVTDKTSNTSDEFGECVFDATTCGSVIFED